MNSGRRTARQEEEFLVLRRNAELRKQEHWNNVAQYFKTWDVKASKYAAWTSQQYFQHSEEARVEAEKKEKQVQSLTERKEKLKNILQSEEKLYAEELQKNARPGTSWMPLSELKSINLEIKRRTEESRKREAELIQYQRWRQQQPTLKDVERRQHLDFMKKSWIEQVREKEAAKEKKKVEEILKAKEEELKRKKEEMRERELQKQKEENLKSLRQQLKSQMDAIEESAKRYQELEKQENEERELHREIEEMIVQRKLAEVKQADKQLAAFWTRQYQQKLQRKAKEMEEEILQDQSMLERLRTELKQEVQSKAQVKETAKYEVEQALKELQAHRQRELLRQKEYENMFYEEAKRAYETQELKWAQERQARDKLMNEVLDTIKKQVEEKLRLKSARKAEELEFRDQQLKGLFSQSDSLKMDEKMAKEQYHKELDQQLKEKSLEKSRKAYEEAEAERKLAEAEIEAEQKLAEEIKKMQLETEQHIYRPQDFRRRRALW